MDFEIKNNITTSDIKDELYNGNIVIAGFDGTKLNNPNFKSPGPAHHTILIIGYDPSTQEFITNDPGTSHGGQYRYSETVISDALRDYPTGNHKPVTTLEKNIIVIRPTS